MENKRRKVKKSSNKSKNKKRNKLKIALLSFLAIILFSIGFGYAYLHNLLDLTEKESISDTDSDLGIKETADNGVNEYFFEEVKGITNVALFGIDAEQGQRGRSDSIMIVTVDRNSKKIKLSSIIRDSYVNIPERGLDKINHAYAFGGPQLALRTLNSNFNLNIKDYATVNFTTMPKIIDTIGGIEITITNAESTKMPGVSGAGTYNLSGDQALAYSRIRKIDSDFNRAERQRNVIEAIINKLLTRPVTSYPSILSEILPLVTTNMSSTEIMGIGTSVITNGITTIEQNRFPEDDYGEGQMINGIYYYVFDREQAVKRIGKYIYLDEK